MTYDPTQVAFVDTETTGLHPERHQIWEIAVIVDGVEHVWQQHLAHTIMHIPHAILSPSDDGHITFAAAQAGGVAIEATTIHWHNVDPWVLENTGIYERYVHAEALPPTESIERFVDLVRGRHLVGAVPSFDSERLHRQWRVTHAEQWEMPWHYHLIDAEALAVGALARTEAIASAMDRTDVGPVPDLPWDSSKLSLHMGVDPEDPAFQPKHSALADARWAKAVFEAVMGGPE